MAWVLYRTSNRVVETFSETPFFRVPDHFSQRQVTVLPAGIARGSVYNASFTAITNPSTSRTLIQNLQLAFDIYWAQSQVWATSLLSYSDSDLTIPKRGIAYIDHSKMCLRNRYNITMALSAGATKDLQLRNLATSANIGALGALDVIDAPTFATLVNSFPDPTGQPRFWVRDLISGTPARTNLSDAVAYGQVIPNFNPRERFWI